MLARNADLNNNDIYPYPLSKLFTTVFPSKWRLRNDRRNSILMTHPYPDLGGASDWLKENFKPIRSTTQIWVVTRHQYGITVLISQTSFRGETSVDFAKCRVFFTGYSHVSAYCFTRICTNVVTNRAVKIRLGNAVTRSKPKKMPYLTLFF